MVSQYLPYLRRYARALTGNQSSGDAYVAATLEALVADQSLLNDPHGPRVALFRLFTRIWNSLPVNGEADAPETALPGDNRLAVITPLPRQAFLLVALEGFSEPDAARILDIEVTKLRALVEESGRELASEIATDVLIIEDETFIAGLSAGRGLCRVIGVAERRRSCCTRQEKAPWSYTCRYSTCRRQFRHGGRARIAGSIRSTGHFHHRLSRTLSDRNAS
jgi:DNA-directed RNA polymerase specialized sigma24 family protein